MPLLWLDKEIRPRVSVVGLVPDQATVNGLFGSVLMEIAEDWQAVCARTQQIESGPEHVR